MANHLIIGLGGTGGKVLREMRKRVYEEFHSNEPTNNINLEYIYAFVSSNPNEAIVAMKVEDTQKAISVFEKNNAKILSEEDLEKI